MLDIGWFLFGLGLVTDKPLFCASCSPFMVKLYDWLEVRMYHVVGWSFPGRLEDTLTHWWVVLLMISNSNRHMKPRVWSGSRQSTGSALSVTRHT